VRVDFIDQTLRDGQQSLWGLRMRPFQAAEALKYLDQTGFRMIDLTGPGMITVLLRSFREDPWAATDFLVAGLPASKLRAATRTNSVGVMGFSPDSVVDLWIRTAARHGIDSFWIFDCLYDMPRMKRVVEVVKDAGAEPTPTVMYGLTDLHTDEFFAERAREMAGWDVPTVELEDAPGVLTVDRARTLLPAIRAATGETPLELHCHNTTGEATRVYVEGLRHGIDIIHTASRPMANGPSLPSTETMLDNLAVLGHEHGLDPTQLAPVAEHFARVAAEAGYETGIPSEFSLRPYEHQLPGGMTGSLKSQLAEHGMQDRLQQVLEEIPRVREELGQPIMATPFSQFVGIQALLNVVSGDRYKLVPDEIIQYTLGQFGPLMRPVQADVRDRILAAERAPHFEAWEQPQPTIAELRARFGRTISDEELLLRVLFSGEEVDGMLASGPPRTDPRTSSSAIVENVRELVSEARHASSLAISQPGLSLKLRRRASGAR
jgi:oxaloacetate decarboxylase (Na+ extruding) subunit alpha